MITAALNYISHGLGHGPLKIIPLVPGTNRPALKDWPNAASSDPQVITEWWERNHAYGIGVLTGAVNHLVVADIDMKYANGLAELREWLAAGHLEIPETLYATTPNQGWHIYLHTDAEQVETRHLASVDFQGDKTFVAAPPTLARIRQSTLRSPGSLPPETRPLLGAYQFAGPSLVAQCPPGLLAAIGRLPPRHAGPAGDGSGWGDLPPTQDCLAHGLPAPRDTNLTALAARLVREGLPWSQGYQVMRAVADRSTLTTPWSDENLRGKWESAGQLIAKSDAVLAPKIALWEARGLGKPPKFTEKDRRLAEWRSGRGL